MDSVTSDDYTFQLRDLMFSSMRAHKCITASYCSCLSDSGDKFLNQYILCITLTSELIRRDSVQELESCFMLPSTEYFIYFAIALLRVFVTTLLSTKLRTEVLISAN